MEGWCEGEVDGAGGEMVGKGRREMEVREGGGGVIGEEGE